MKNKLGVGFMVPSYMHNKEMEMTLYFHRLKVMFSKYDSHQGSVFFWLDEKSAQKIPLDSHGRFCLGKDSFTLIDIYEEDMQ